MNSLQSLFLFILCGIFLSACKPDTPPPKSDGTLTVMTYNIRYDNPEDGINAWDNRKERLTNLVKLHNPGILGIQEGLLHQVRYLEKKLGTYSWIGVGRQDGTMNGEFSAIFYDTTRIKLLPDSENTIWLSKTPSKPSKSWDAALPRILTYGQFRLRANGRQFFAFNTHFDHIGDTARAKSAQLIVDRIKETAGNKPVILTGDFNAVPGSKPYALLTSGQGGLHDAFEVTGVPSAGPLFTYEEFSVKSDNENRRIDYIFVNDRLKVRNHAIISSFRHGRYPSDHLPVISNIAFAN